MGKIWQRLKLLIIAGCVLLSMLTAWPVLAAAPYEQEEVLVSLINKERIARKLVPVRLRAELSEAALQHSRDMLSRETLTHDSLNGDTARERVDRAGYRWKTFGEIIGREHSGSAHDMLNIWLASPPHAEILLSPEYTEVGVGVAHRRGRFATWYWTAVFGSGMNKARGGR